jgi:arabinogalactan oligomer/maltooligosaccharide transport system permease protein
MSTVTSTSPAPLGQPFKPGVIPRVLAAFSGPAGFAVKIVLLSASNALAAWAVYVLVSHGRWPAVGVVAAATAAIDWLYLAPRRWTLPAKFLIPGTVFLIGFQIVPILYTIDVAFSNYSTGHILTKQQAISTIQVNSLQPSPNGQQYDMLAVRNASGDLVLILHGETDHKVYLGTPKGLTPLPQSAVKLDPSGIPVGAKGFTPITGAALFSLDQQLRTYKVPVGKLAAIEPQGTRVAVALEPTLRFDPQTDTFTRIGDGTVFRDNGSGSFVAGKEDLEPGWKTSVGFRNFDRMFTDPLVRKPFFSIFLWTFVFAACCVLGSFACGLFLAIALDKRGMRLQRLYRSVMVIPYAIPGFLSLLIWAGLFNDDYGVINRHLLHPLGVQPPWLFGGNVFTWLPFVSWPRIAVVLVSIWLTTPYFFLVSMGALQSIPEELTEAARVDGGNPFQIFRRVTLPLLLVAVTPLMIASFAFNFNNFNNVYLMTKGGPYNGQSSIAGNTDILISYTYKVAIASGKGNDYGLASAFGIVIFFLVAAISGVSFWRSKALESVR